jgi:hypothetical protein
MKRKRIAAKSAKSNGGNANLRLAGARNHIYRFRTPAFSNPQKPSIFRIISMFLLALPGELSL